MLVRRVMSAPVECFPADLTCAEARQRMTDRGLRRAPLVDAHGKLCGMLTEGDLAGVLPRTIEDLERGEEHPAFHTTVLAVAATRVFTLAPNDHVEQAAATMLRKKIGGLPVIDPNGEVVGILTESDLFRLFVRRTLTQPGHRLVLRASRKTVEALGPADLCSRANARLFDLGMFPLDAGRLACTMVLASEDLDALLEAFNGAGYETVLVERA